MYLPAHFLCSYDLTSNRQSCVAIAKDMSLLAVINNLKD